jgi:hypothetical protein
MEEMESTVASLQKELAYMKAVLANQSTISSLLRNIHQTPGVTMKTSFSAKGAKTVDEGKRRAVIAANRRLIEKENECDSDEEGEVSPKRRKLDHDYAVPAGVCLHVSNKEVSLEFCSSCSESAGAAAPRIRRGRPSKK